MDALVWVLVHLLTMGCFQSCLHFDFHHVGDGLKLLYPRALTSAISTSRLCYLPDVSGENDDLYLNFVMTMTKRVMPEFFDRNLGRVYHAFSNDEGVSSNVMIFRRV